MSIHDTARIGSGIPHVASRQFFDNPALWRDGGIFDQLAAERAAQDAKWGEQNHPDGTDKRWVSMAAVYRREADQQAELGTLTWAHIMREEIYESLSEEDPAKLRDELIQVAAVAVSWIEAIDRRSAQ